MTPLRSLAYSAARKLLSGLPLPIATPVELVRAADGTTSRPLAFKRVALAGKGAADADLLVRHLEDAGARVEGPGDSPSDVVIGFLPERAGAEDLAGLYAMLHARVETLHDRGRVLLVVRSGAPIVTAGVHGFVRSLARELGGRGTTVNAVVSQDLELASPIVAFLASERASYVSGQTWTLHAGAIPVQVPSPGPRLAVVTGAAQGIGESIVRVLAANGYRIALLDLESQTSAGRSLSDAIGGEPAGMAFHACDVRDTEQVARVLETARAASPMGMIDLLVNNAGISRDRTFRKMTPQEWAEVHAVDLAAVVGVTRSAQPLLAPSARVVNVASVSGLAGNFGQTNYACAKGAVVGYTAQVARELEPRGIAVTAVAPGLIETAMSQAIPALQREVAAQMTSLAQLGLPQDVAMVVELLGRREAWPLRGQAVRVDGGMFFGS